jgi:hypothetical protein
VHFLGSFGAYTFYHVSIDPTRGNGVHTNLVLSPLGSKAPCKLVNSSCVWSKKRISFLRLRPLDDLRSFSYKENSLTDDTKITYGFLLASKKIQKKTLVCM